MSGPLMTKINNMDADKNIRSLIDNGSELAGTAAGIVLGFLFAGPIGVVGGAAGGVVIKQLLCKLGTEIQDRGLGQREYIRIGAAAIFALEHIKKCGEQGLEIRRDGFFSTDDTERSDAEEILEGVFLKCKASHEEKKVKYNGCFFANVAFNPNFSVQEANFFLNLYARLTYRQISLMKIFYLSNKYSLKKDELMMGEISSEMGILLQEVSELMQLSLLKQMTKNRQVVSFLTNIQHINLSRIEVTNHGISFIKHFDLENIPEEDLIETLKSLK